MVLLEGGAGHGGWLAVLEADASGGFEKILRGLTKRQNCVIIRGSADRGRRQKRRRLIAGFSVGFVNKIQPISVGV